MQPWEETVDLESRCRKSEFLGWCPFAICLRAVSGQKKAHQVPPRKDLREEFLLAPFRVLFDGCLDKARHGRCIFEQFH